MSAEQLAFGAMPRRLFPCTPSRLVAFDCPRRYRMTYVDRPTPPRGAPWAHNTLGAAVHLALHRWWSAPRAERTPRRGAALVEQAWQSDGFRDPEQSAQWRTIAAGWVERYLEDVDPAAEPAGVERTVGTTTPRLAVSGRVDRIEDRGGELVVVDYKTGRTISTPDEARGSIALAIYALAVRRTFRRTCRRVELHHLPSGTVASFEHTDASLARHVGRAEATAADIEAAGAQVEAGRPIDVAYPPVPGPGCAWCDFRRLCPEGRAASPARESWAGLADA